MFSFAVLFATCLSSCLDLSCPLPLHCFPIVCSSYLISRCLSLRSLASACLTRRFTVLCAALSERPNGHSKRVEMCFYKERYRDRHNQTQAYTSANANVGVGAGVHVNAMVNVKAGVR